MVSGSGSAEIRVKAGSTAKRALPVVVNPVRVVGLTQPADQPWRNAKALRAKPQLVRKLHQSGCIGRVSKCKLKSMTSPQSYPHFFYSDPGLG